MKKLLLITAALTLMVSAANATILWDQSTVDPANSYMDSYSIGPWGDVIVYGACDFNLGAPATITSITTWYSANGEWIDGGYETQPLWLMEGWAVREKNGWDTPLYWWRQDGA